MTSPTEPPKESLRDRVSTRFSTDKKGRLFDAEARHTRNVSWVFYALIGLIVIIAIGGLAYGFWEANLKPLANVDGTEVSRGEWEDRQALEAFRFDRAETQISAALAEGTISSDLANRRFSDNETSAPGSDSEVMADLVDLLFKQQLAAEMGIELTADESSAAVLSDGAFEEARLIEALFVLTEEQEQGLAATDAGIADARVRADAAVAAIRDGANAEDLVETHAPANFDSAFVTAGSIGDAAWSDAMFALDEGGVTDPVEAATGEQLIAVVKQIAPAQADEGFVEAVNDEVGEEVYRRNVELEAIAAKLENQITTEALATEYDQVELAEIYLESNPLIDPDDDEGDVRASHILYTPDTPLDEEGNPTALADLPEDDPAWAQAQMLAERAARQLAMVGDVDARVDAFATRAQRDSDGPSGPRGGDLGYFPPGYMVPKFNAAIFESEDLQRGDIVGPVRSQFGWHVIMYDESRAPLADRLAEVETALAEEGADFAAVAAEFSDGPEAAAGGETGWHLLDDLDDLTVLALTAVDPGETTDAIDDGDGYRIYLKLDEATRQLGPAAAALLEDTAFADWYDERYFTAQTEGRISIDDSVYGG